MGTGRRTVAEGIFPDIHRLNTQDVLIPVVFLWCRVPRMTGPDPMTDRPVKQSNGLFRRVAKGDDNTPLYFLILGTFVAVPVLGVWLATAEYFQLVAMPHDPADRIQAYVAAGTFFATFAAVFIAIGIEWWRDRRDRGSEEQARWERTLSFATRAAPTLLSLHRFCLPRGEGLRQNIDEPDFDDRGMFMLAVQSDLCNSRHADEALQILKPPPIDPFLSGVGILEGLRPSAQIQVMQVLGFYQAFEAMRHGLALNLSERNAVPSEDDRKALIARLSVLCQAATNTQRILGSLFEEAADVGNHALTLEGFDVPDPEGWKNYIEL